MATLTVAGDLGPEEAGDESEDRVLRAARELIGRLDTLVQEQIRAKAPIEDRWLEDLRNYHGRYAPQIESDLREDKRSTAFVKLTRHKTNGWAARLSDLLFPTDDRNWGIQPTPLPMLVEAAKQAQQAAMAQVEEANATADAGDQAKAEMIAVQADAYAQAARQSAAEMEEAKRRAERMQEAIDDQLIESQYIAHCRDVIEDGCRIGTGILKGPLTSNRLRGEWRNERGFWELAQLPDPQPEFVRVDPWHFFPDMSGRSVDEAEFTFERSLPTKKDLRRGALKLGFSRAGVRRLLKEGPGEITGTDLTYLSNLRDITGESEAIRGRYVLWEYHGPLECNDIATLLRAMDRDDEARAYEEDADPLEEHRVIIHFCNNEVLKIAPEYPLDSGDSLYSVWNFEKSETGIFGVGIPHLMADSQGALNGAWRMMMDNSALSVGPQIVIDKGAVVPENGSYGIRPLKTWLRTTTAVNQQQPPFQVFNIPNNQQPLAGIIELAKMFADEETSSPTIDQGDVGAQAQTLGGLSMLFNSANVVKRRVVKSFDDDLTAPTIRRAYEWNMQFNPDDSIKGDMQIDARGSSVLLVREVQSIHLMNIAQNWTAHPVMGSFVKPRDVMVKTLQTLMIAPDEVLYTEEEAERRMQQAAEAAQQQQQKQPQLAEPAQREDYSLQIAQLESETKLQVVQAEREIKLMELSMRENIGVEELQTKLHLKKLETDSKERMKATDIAIESQREMNARQSGFAPQEAVGVGVG